jgi:hypothetical protein
MAPDEGFSVVVSAGHYDFCHPEQEQVNIRIAIPGLEVANLSVPFERGEHLRSDSMPWSEVIEEILRLHKEVYFLSSHRERDDAIGRWLVDEANAAHLDLAWSERRLSQLQRRADSLDEEIHRVRRIRQSCQDVLEEVQHDP